MGYRVKADRGHQLLRIAAAGAATAPMIGLAIGTLTGLLSVLIVAYGIPWASIGLFFSMLVVAWAGAALGAAFDRHRVALLPGMRVLVQQRSLARSRDREVDAAVADAVVVERSMQIVGTESGRPITRPLIRMTLRNASERVPLTDWLEHTATPDVLHAASTLARELGIENIEVVTKGGALDLGGRRGAITRVVASLGAVIAWSLVLASVLLGVLPS